MTVGHMLFWWRNIKRQLGGLPPMTREQWLIDRAIFACTMTARHTYFLLATGATYDREPSKFATYLTQWYASVSDNSDTVYTEADIIAAYQELQSHNLVDDMYRPRMMYDIVDDR